MVMISKHIICLAGGNSRRFGRENKLLYEFKGKALYLHVIDMLESFLSREDITIHVVTQYEEIYDTVIKRGFRAVMDKECKKGISYSIRAGINDIYDIKEQDYILFVVADQPGLSASTLERVLELADGETLTGSVRYDGKPGNPTIFSGKLRDELMSLEGDKGGRVVIRKHQCRWIEVEDPEELWDLDEL